MQKRALLLGAVTGLVLVFAPTAGAKRSDGVRPGTSVYSIETVGQVPAINMENRPYVGACFLAQVGMSWQEAYIYDGGGGS